jgi:hypothetical protein
MADFKEETIGGVTIKIPEKGFASEETLEALVKALKTGKGPAGDIKRAGDAAKNFSQRVNEASETLKKQNPALKLVQKGFDMLGSALVGGAGLAKAIMNLNGSFSSLGGVIDFGVEKIRDSFIASIPFIGKATADAAYAIGEMTKMQLEFMDMQRGAFASLSMAGRTAAVDIAAFQSSVFQANMQLGQFVGVFNDNIDGLRTAFGSVEGIQRSFVTNLAQMTNPGSEFGMSLRLLGLGAEDIANEFADFVSVNSRNRLLMNIGEKELQSAIMERAKNERILAEFTGMSVQEQRQEQMALMGDMAYQAALLSEVPAQFRAEMTQFTAGLEQFGLQDVGKQILGFNQILDPNTALIQSAVPELVDAVRNAQDAIKRGVDPAVAMEDVVRVAGQNIDNLIPLLKLGLIPGGEMFVQSLGKLTSTALQQETQLANFNKIMGTEYSDMGVAMSAFNDQFNMDIIAAQNLAKDFEKSGMKFEDFIKTNNLNGLSEENLKLIAQTAKMEEAQTDMQQNVFNVTQNFRGLADIIIETQEAFAKLLDDMGVGSGINAAKIIQNINTVTSQVGTGNKGQGNKEIMRTVTQYYDAQGNEMRYDSNQGIFVPMKGMGGPMNRGLYIVGERGPELVSMNGGSGFVYNNAQTNAIMGATPRFTGGPIGTADTGSLTTASAVTKISSDPNVIETKNVTNAGNNKMDVAFKDMTDSLGSSNSELKNMNKLLKQVFTKIASKDGYY